MGTWDTGSFDNDTAGDWSYGLEQVTDLSYVEAALDGVLASGPGQAIPSEVAEAAVAAAEVVARLKGQWGEENSYSATADEWVRGHPIHPPPPLVAKAVAALERITRPPSELLELWSEGEGADAWVEAVMELRGRVGS